MSKRNIYTSDNFILSLFQTRRSTKIEMQMVTSCINTKDLPHTFSFLAEYFPDVLETECFNDCNLPFQKEVLATEIGHLFEHILLEQLCCIKVLEGDKNVVFNGKTSWNWEKDPQGLFHIMLDIGEKDIELLINGLGKTIHLIERLLSPTRPSTESLVFNFA